MSVKSLNELRYILSGANADISFNINFYEVEE